MWRTKATGAVDPAGQGNDIALIRLSSPFPGVAVTDGATAVPAARGELRLPRGVLGGDRLGPARRRGRPGEAARTPAACRIICARSTCRSSTTPRAPRSTPDGSRTARCARVMRRARWTRARADSGGPLVVPGGPRPVGRRSALSATAAAARSREPTACTRGCPSYIDWILEQTSPGDARVSWRQRDDSRAAGFT